MSTAPLMESDGLHRSGTISLLAPCCVTFFIEYNLNLARIYASFPSSFYTFLSVRFFPSFFFSVYSNNKGIIFATFNNNQSLLKGFETKLQVVLTSQVGMNIVLSKFNLSNSFIMKVLSS